MGKLINNNEKISGGVNKAEKKKVKK